MMAQEIHLNGGPWHDRLTVLPDGHDHFHIMGLDRDDVHTNLAIVREGTYSRVRGYPGEFEWDGWTTHED